MTYNIGLYVQFQNKQEDQNMNSIHSQLRRGLGVRFCLVVLATIVIISSIFLQTMLLFPRQNVDLYQGYHNELIFRALSSDTTSAFLPVLAAIPLAAEYQEDVKSKFARFCLIRGNYSDYLLSLCVACWLCGGGAVFLGTLEVWGMTTLLFTPMERVMENPTDLTPQIADRIVLLFLNGGMWAMVGIALSTIMESKYIAYVSPFIFYYLLVILYERYFPNVWLLYPKNWLDPGIWPYGVGSAAVFLLELTFFTGLLFYIRGRRRLESL